MSFYKEEIKIKATVEDTYSKLLTMIGERTKVKVFNKSNNEGGFIIEGKTKIQWLKNSWATYLKVKCDLLERDLLKIELSVNSKMSSFTQGSTNKAIFDVLVNYIKENFKIDNTEQYLTKQQNLNYNKSTIEKNENKTSYLSNIDEIRELKKLYDEGILTEEEFNMQKKSIINK